MHVCVSISKLITLVLCVLSASRAELHVFLPGKLLLSPKEAARTKEFLPN